MAPDWVTLYNKVHKKWVVTEERMSNEWWTTRALTGALAGALAGAHVLHTLL